MEILEKILLLIIIACGFFEIGLLIGVRIAK